MNINTLNEWLILVAGIIVSITTIGSALIWVLKKIYLEPMDKRRAERAKEVEVDRQKFEKKLLENMEANQQPLSEAIDRLNKVLEELERDNMSLHKIADINVQTIGEHEKRLDNHNDRLIVLEVKNGVRTVTYKEEK